MGGSRIDNKKKTKKMRKVGDYSWRQISMWEFTPDVCIEKFIPYDGGAFHFYLTRCYEIVDPKTNHVKIETVESIEGVPDSILNWRDCGYKIKNRSEK